MNEITDEPVALGLPPEDRPAVPAGRQMLFCVGAQKAGTTWLAGTLGKHPACHFFPFEKELHYFDTAYRVHTGMKKFRLRQVRRLFEDVEEAEGPRYADLIRRMQGNLDLLKVFRSGKLGAQAWMHLLSRGAGQARYLCDFTPDYAYCPPEAYAEMASYVSPEGARPKFIFVMRDPVDRHWSFLRMLIRHRDVPIEEAPQTLRGWLTHDVSTGVLARRNNCDYRRTVEMLEAHVPPEDRLVLFYEDLFTQERYDQICDFLGIDRTPADFSTVHEGLKSGFPEDLFQPARESLGDIYDFAFERYGDAVPERWRRETP